MSPHEKLMLDATPLIYDAHKDGCCHIWQEEHDKVLGKIWTCCLCDRWKLREYNPRRLPTTIGFHHTKCGTYEFDTRVHMDGMPHFRGYTWEEWTKPWR